MKFTLPILLTCAAALFSSCDSSTLLNTSIDETKVATVLKVPALGDKLIFSNTDGKPGPFIEEVVLTGAETVTAFAVYEYRQISSQRFDIDVVNILGDSSIDVSLDGLLGEPTTLSSRFRELILREEAVFTTAELEEIVGLLNPAGASLIIDPDNPLQILSTVRRRYHFEVTSNEGDKIRGSMGGSYYAEENSFIVGFREPTGSELNTYRFLTIKHKIPFITGISNGIQITERGTFVLDLVNRNNQPR